MYYILRSVLGFLVYDNEIEKCWFVKLTEDHDKDDLNVRNLDEILKC